MKVNGPGGPSLPTSAPRTGRSTAEGFKPTNTAGLRESAAATRAGALSGVSSLDALLALQEVDGPLERRRRAVRRGGRILDVLDEVKLALLDGGAGQGSLSRLMDAVRMERGQTEDPGLEGVLDEIETRAAVELAKWETARAA